MLGHCGLCVGTLRPRGMQAMVRCAPAWAHHLQSRNPSVQGNGTHATFAPTVHAMLWYSMTTRPLLQPQRATFWWKPRDAYDNASSLIAAAHELASHRVTDVIIYCQLYLGQFFFGSLHVKPN